jgi:sirohydrochlorin ferrochelatase
MPELGESIGVIVVDHGSRRAEANGMLECVAAAFRAQSGVGIVEHAHMELAPPTIGDAFDACVARGARHVVVCLYFLSPGRHSREDIPALAAEAAARHPGVGFSVTQPLGVDARIADVMAERVREALV